MPRKDTQADDTWKMLLKKNMGASVTQRLTPSCCVTPLTQQLLPS